MLGPKIKNTVHGWIILDKPKGLTSTQALGKVRRIMGGKKVGHGGTLDPLATGILPLAFGEATKLVPHVMDSDKEYEFSVRWGEARTTDDAEGTITTTSNKRPSEADIRAALPAFIGTVSQKPPAFSALKIDGERAYDLARAGEVVELKPRPVTIHAFELVGIPNQDHALFKVHCGKGTYVRALARDLAEKLGTYGHVAQLRRTRVGGFDESRAISLATLEQLGHKGDALTALWAMKQALDDIPALELTATEAQRIRAGQSILIRPQQDELINAAIIFAEFQGVPVALIAPKAGEFRVVRGFQF